MANVVNQAVTAVSGMIASPLSEGSKIPATLLKQEDPMKKEFNLSEVPGKIVVVGVPGAFSPQCSSQAPGYLENAQKFADKGVQGIYIVAVNDTFVLKAWKEQLGAQDSKLVHFLSDDTGAWSAAAGMSIDATPIMGNFRSNRFAALVEDGVVKKVVKEEQPTGVTVTTADSFLQNI